MAHCKKENDKIFWNVNKSGTGQVVYKNGLKKQLAVNFLSPEDGKVKISEICRNIASDSTITKEQIYINYLDSKFQAIINPDPDLALYFGDICCTFGLLPWHIRLTEFYNIQSQRSLSVETFLNALFTYSKCEQRFGY